MSDFNQEEYNKWVEDNNRDNRRAPYIMVGGAIVLYFLYAIIMNLFGIDIFQVGETFINYIKASIYNWLF